MIFFLEEEPGARFLTTKGVNTFWESLTQNRLTGNSEDANPVGCGM